MLNEKNCMQCKNGTCTSYLIYASSSEIPKDCKFQRHHNIK